MIGFLRAVVPTITIFITLMLSIFAHKQLGIVPALYTAPLFYWLVFKPTCLPMLMIVSLFIVSDTLTQSIVGAESLPILVFCWFILSQRHRVVLEGFPFQILLYVLSAFLFFCAFSSIEFIDTHNVRIIPITVSLLINIAMFWPLHYLTSGLDNLSPDSDVLDDASA